MSHTDNSHHTDNSSHTDNSPHTDNSSHNDNPTAVGPTLQKGTVLKSLLAVGLLVLGLIWFMARKGPAELTEQIVFSGFTMGTTYSVKVLATDDTQVQLAIKKMIDQKLAEIDRTMSRYNPDSEISKFNAHRSNKPFALSPLPMAVVAYAVELSRQTGGAFDISVGPLIRLWGFHEKKMRQDAPTPAEIKQAMSLVGVDKYVIDRSAGSVQKAVPALDLDLSSIAKGFGVDQVAEGLEALGVNNYMVEIGGEVRCAGTKATGAVWRVGIEKPKYDDREVWEALPLHNASMATSGDYRSYYDLAGKRISHTIDPRTGSPITHGLAAVSVIHKSCMKADAIATALTVLGPIEGFAFAQKQNIAAMLVTREKDGSFTVQKTDGFKKIAKSR